MIVTPTIVLWFMPSTCLLLGVGSDRLGWDCRLVLFFIKKIFVNMVLNDIFEDEAVVGVMSYCSMEFAELVQESSHDCRRVCGFWELY